MKSSILVELRYEVEPFSLSIIYTGLFNRDSDNGISRCVLRKGLTLQSYCGDGIGTINPTLGRGLDS